MMASPIRQRIENTQQATPVLASAQGDVEPWSDHYGRRTPASDAVAMTDGPLLALAMLLCMISLMQASSIGRQARAPMAVAVHDHRHGRDPPG